jgi:hypothetical protein
MNGSRHAAFIHAAYFINLFSDLLDMVEILSSGMVQHGDLGKQAAKRKVKNSCSICRKLVDGSVCCDIQAESAKTRQSYAIYRTDKVNCGGLETESPRCCWIQLIPPRNGILADNNDSMNFEESDCAPNDYWYNSMVSVYGVSTILV